MQGRRAFFGAGASLLLLNGCSPPPPTLAFWHAMPGVNGAQLNRLAATFNATQPGVPVQPVYKGAYPDLLNSVIAAWRAGDAPHIAQIFDVATATMLHSRAAVIPVSRLAAETGVTIPPNAYEPAIRAYYAPGKPTETALGGLPLNSSTAMMWINRTVFRRAGLDPDAPLSTWKQVLAAARTIKRRGAADVPLMTTAPIWQQFEQFSAIHDIPFASLDNGFGGDGAQLDIAAPPFVSHLTRLQAARAEGLFVDVGREGAASSLFLAGRAGICFDSSSTLGPLRAAAAFDFAAQFLPFDPAIAAKPANSFTGGAALWALTRPGRRGAEYRRVAQFFAFLSRPENDSQWARATGYLPVTTAGRQALAGYYATEPAADLAIRQVTRQPQRRRGIRLSGMQAVRRILADAWDQVIEAGLPPEAILLQAQDRGNVLLRAFARTAAA